MGQPFLEVDGITKRFGGLVAVNDVSFSMTRDEIIGLIGPNGAGKTTLLRLITGILKADEGSIRFKGKELVGAKTWDIVNLGIACTFQNMRPFTPGIRIERNGIYMELNKNLRSHSWEKLIHFYLYLNGRISLPYSTKKME